MALHLDRIASIHSFSPHNRNEIFRKLDGNQNFFCKSREQRPAARAAWPRRASEIRALSFVQFPYSRSLPTPCRTTAGSPRLIKRLRRPILPRKPNRTPKSVDFLRITKWKLAQNNASWRARQLNIVLFSYRMLIRWRSTPDTKSMQSELISLQLERGKDKNRIIYDWSNTLDQLYHLRAIDMIITAIL